MCDDKKTSSTVPKLKNGAMGMGLKHCFLRPQNKGKISQSNARGTEPAQGGPKPLKTAIDLALSKRNELSI